ncbi:phosphonopyruvate decarboxylase [Paraburkholderia tropica]|uniref:Phosphonopyruvate decarboxylase n=1 Tax=Paraburkholderia tropica TaxID=92647 RepID=A0AAQ1GNT6_9BURK|nr:MULTISPECIES: phosphonopyruvate decarboxylase [Paraburkholderia]QNB13743.1 phosphonopyruvate decarboxylase [Paraburkholderia tropica]RQM45811.1 phosphonopyruvate decarboxylase [Paraburkholderia bannensis]RQN33924.1 phosphonopyruvate decarboxylase [Paraburkholderia tropica]SEK14893.1 phosphonopyruvate decarboxylase [Paraburkholderia tropica]
MIEAAQFVEAARARGFEWYAGVPCSFLTPFINYVLQDESLHYVSSANEGDAVALIAGVALAGKRGIAMMQNSGLGNAVSPLTSLTWTFRLPQLLIVTWRGQPGVSDEPQHALMGPVTPQMLDTMDVPWELFPTEADQIAPVLERAIRHMDETGRPYALVMQKGSVAPFELKGGGSMPAKHALPVAQSKFAGVGYDDLPTRQQALERVIAATPAESTVVVASTGFCGRELYAIDDRSNQLYMVGSMGCVSSFALGLALARPDLNVVALDGDGAALMRMGNFATLGAYGPSNLTHVLLDNGAHDSTGGQATVAQQVSFANVAAACGYADAVEGDELATLDAVLEAARERATGANGVAGARFVRLTIKRGTPDGLPRPTITPPDVKSRLMRHIGAEAAAAVNAAQ